MIRPDVTAQPAVVIVHGAWHTPWHYSTLVTELQERGFIVVCPQLPSQSDVLPLPDNANYEHDVVSIRETLSKLISQGHAVTVVAHSYGGLVANGAIGSLLENDAANSLQDNKAPGGGIAHVVYISAFVIPVGTSIVTPFKGELPPFLDEQSVHSTCTMRDAANAFYNDVDSPELVKNYLNHNVHCPKSVIEVILTTAPYEAMRVGDIDATYLINEQDVNMPAPVAEMMAELLGPKKRIKRSNTGHCPTISQPAAVADVVAEAWAVSKQRLDPSRASLLVAGSSTGPEAEPPTGVVGS